MAKWKPDMVDDETRRKFLKATGLSVAASFPALAGCSGGSGDSQSNNTGGGSGDSQSNNKSSNISSNNGSNTDGNSGKDASGESKEISGTLKFSMSYAPWNLDYALYQDTASSYIVDNIYDNLVTYDQNMKLQPQLATEMPEVNDDRTSYTFNLRDDVFFHGGEKKMTAEDVAYSMNWLLEDPPKNVTGYVKPYVEEAEVVDESTIRFNLKQSFALLPEYLTRVFAVVRKGTHGELGEGEGPTGTSSQLTEGPRKSMAASTGPWYVTEWKSGSHVTTKANEDYWMEGAPNIETIRYEVIPEPSTRLSAIRSGASDMLNVVPPKDFKSLGKQPDIQTENVGGLKTEVMYFNNQSGIFSDVNLRKAVAYAIDRKAIKKQIFYDQLVPQWSPIWESKYVPDELKYKNQDWAKNDEKRNELVQDHLKKAGKPDGFKFDCLATDAQWFVPEAQLIAGQLKKYGIEMNIKPMKNPALFDIVYGGPEAPYEAALEDFGIPMPAPEYWLYDGYADVPNHLRWLEAKDAPGEGTNTPWVGEYKKTVNKAISATNEEDRLKPLTEAQRITIEKMGQVNIGYYKLSRAWRSSVKDYPGVYRNNQQEFRPVSIEK